MLTDIRLAAMREIVIEQFAMTRSDPARRRAEKFMQEAVINSPLYPEVSMRDTNLWADRNARSHERYLHGFLFFTDWFGTILLEEETREAACEAALRIIESWAVDNGDFPGSSPMAYHDETTAQRLIVLLQLQLHLVNNVPTESIQFVRSLMDKTANLLADSTFHSPGNNHGMFQDLAILYYAVLADWNNDPTREDYLRLAFGRLSRYFTSCFTSEGVHVENTPTYHVMVSRHISVVQRLAEILGHPDAELYAKLLNKAEKYATHALMPNGLYPPVSDTAQRPVRSTAILRVFSSKEFLYAASAGELGKPPQERVLALPETGYLIYRSSWTDRDATYAFFSAAYHSGYHKHSDDLSLFLRSGDLDLLAEAGPYSYDYKDPLSRYAYSQFSHNSLVVDGRSLPRTDERSSSVTLKVEEQTPNHVVVEGSNGRYDDTKHTRRLEIDESSGAPAINLIDFVKSGNDHTYQLLWNLGPRVTPVIHGQGFELFYGENKVMDLMFHADVPTRITVHKGRTKPRPLGWTFPDFGEKVPSSVVSIEFSGKSAEVKTKIRLADFSYANRELFYKNGWRRYRAAVSLNYLLQPDPNGQVRNLVVCFTAIHQVGDFTYNYKSTIDQTDTATLYILDDFGDQGAYYYSDHGSTAIFDTVQELINSIMREYNLDLDSVATVGSSKGGTAALIHGLALGVSRIIIGAPQTKIGLFVRGAHPNILEFMTGGVSEDDASHLNKIIPNLLSQAVSSTRILVVVGDADHHKKNHVVPLVSEAEKHQVDITPIYLPGVPHAEIGRIFSLFLRANIDQWTRKNSEVALPYKFAHNRIDNFLVIEVYSPQNSEHTYRLYRDSVQVDSLPYSTDRRVVFKDIHPGAYSVRVSSRASETSTEYSFTTRSVMVEVDTGEESSSCSDARYELSGLFRKAAKAKALRRIPRPVRVWMKRCAKYGLRLAKAMPDAWRKS